MFISYQILGAPGRDNALLVHVDSGHAVEHLLFDCGDGCVSQLSFSQIQAIDQLFFSHLHMDHVGGFDSFFRCVFDRYRWHQQNYIWGPPGTAAILQHRFQGFLWNLQDEMAGRWWVSDVTDDGIRTSRFELVEGFAVAHQEPTKPRDQVIYSTSAYTVEAFTMDHRTPTLAYIVRETPRENVDMSRMSALGLKPGAWLKDLKDVANASSTILVNDQPRSREELRRELLVQSPGGSIAYFTDFLLNEAAIERLVAPLRGVQTLVCEGQYRHSDLPLAQKNFHMTTVLTATLAARAEVGELVLFHLSDRYEPPQWVEMLAEARAIFPRTRFPEQWQLG